MLSGYKTWLGLIITFAPSLLNDVQTILTTPGQDTLTRALAIGGKLLVVIGAVHKILKEGQ